MQKRNAQYVMKRTINRIKDEFPVLIPALNLLTPKAVESLERSSAKDTSCMATDGESLFYQPEKLMEVFRWGGFTQIRYLLLHVLFHCILGHLELEGLYRDRRLLWVVFDREVGHLLEELGMEEGACRIAWTNSELDDLLGESYDMGCYFKCKKNRLLRHEVLGYAESMRVDNHKYWRIKEDEEKEHSENNGNSGEASDTKKKGDGAEKKAPVAGGRNREAWKGLREMLAEGQRTLDSKTLLTQLKISQGEGCGSGSAGEMELVRAKGENQNSFYNLLMEFLRNRESPKVPPDAIDYTLYQYGLELYGDMPLIEPPDCEERVNLNTICLAIDTSGSCSEEIAETFLRETYNILRDIRRISRGGEIYLFQCDDELQKEEYYQSLEEIPWEGQESVELFGFGGTSFVPVFQRIEELKEEGKSIDCLIYFTDACGEFPEETPDYPVFFILPMSEKEMRQDKFLKQVPAWIQKVGLE